MHLRHVLAATARRVSRRYPFLRNASLTSTFLTLVWFHVIYAGERTTFTAHIEACQWDAWEEWPKHATPHRGVFVADPQIVDPHTYPGRPWPLSSLTEIYTDRYMSRNFRLVNEKLDPDSVVFLGDLFDGGREWATSRARPLNSNQREVLIKLGILNESDTEGQRFERSLVEGAGADSGALADGAEQEGMVQRTEAKTDLRQYVAGEGGRWSKYGEKQWEREYDRFGNIFFAKEQLYPNTERHLLPALDTVTHAANVGNGAPSAEWRQYAVAGGKQRRLLTSLPGNHDLGIGSGVQIPVRDRFQSHFGEPNGVYVIGNHTFVSLDVPSLSAFDEYVQGVGEVSPERREQYRHVWKPASDFLDDLSATASKAVGEALNEYYPGAHPSRSHWHHVADPNDEDHRPPPDNTSRKPQLPVILLSHVPLYRNPDVDCGRQRERGKSIFIAQGYQYQNVLTPSLSSFIAKKVSTAGDLEHIFSGDDHDYCDITHRFNVGKWDDETKKENAVMKTVREITAKSFSWAMGVRRPGFQLMSLWNPVDDMGRTVGTPLPTIQTHLCLLPDQLGIFIRYAILLGSTLALLVVRATVVGLRNKVTNTDGEDSEDEGVKSLSLPRYQPHVGSKMNGRANGYATPTRAQTESKGRQRASSTSTSHGTHLNPNGTTNLGVQRSYTSRTRSVSPAAGMRSSNDNFNSSNHALPNLQETATGPLIDKAGYYPSVKWIDPADDDDSDEESHVGSHVDVDEREDCQAKHSKPRGRRKKVGRARRAWNEFLASLVFVAVPAGLFYGVILKNG